MGEPTYCTLSRHRIQSTCVIQHSEVVLAFKTTFNYPASYKYQSMLVWHNALYSSISFIVCCPKHDLPACHIYQVCDRRDVVSQSHILFYCILEKSFFVQQISAGFHCLFNCPFIQFTFCRHHQALMVGQLRHIFVIAGINPLSG